MVCWMHYESRERDIHGVQPMQMIRVSSRQTEISTKKKRNFKVKYNKFLYIKACHEVRVAKVITRLVPSLAITSYLLPLRCPARKRGYLLATSRGRLAEILKLLSECTENVQKEEDKTLQ